MQPTRQRQQRRKCLQQEQQKHLSLRLELQHMKIGKIETSKGMGKCPTCSEIKDQQENSATRWKFRGMKRNETNKILFRMYAEERQTLHRQDCYCFFFLQILYEHIKLVMFRMRCMRTMGQSMKTGYRCWAWRHEVLRWRRPRPGAKGSRYYGEGRMV